MLQESSLLYQMISEVMDYACYISGCGEWLMVTMEELPVILRKLEISRYAGKER